MTGPRRRWHRRYPSRCSGNRKQGGMSESSLNSVEPRSRWRCALRAALRGAWFGAKFSLMVAFLGAAILMGIVSLGGIGPSISVASLVFLFIIFPVVFSLIGAGVAAVVSAMAAALAS